MGVTISGSGTISSDSGSVSFDDDNITTSGTIPAAQLTGTMPALNGAALTALNASNIASGTVPVARLGSGASATKFLRGDGTFQEAGGVTELISTVTAVESDNASFLTFTPTTGWFDNTYTSMWIEGEMIRAASNNQYMRYQLSTADSGGTHTFRTNSSHYRMSGVVRRNLSEQNQGSTSNILNITAGDSSAYGFDTLANMTAMGRFYVDLGWFAQTSVAGVNKTTAATNGGGRPILSVYQYNNPNNTTTDVQWTTIISIYHNTTLAGITNATKWSGIRFYMNSGVISGQMRLWGRK